MNLSHLFVGVTAAAGIGSTLLLAATITENVVTVPGLSGQPAAISNTLRMTGPIEAGDAERLRAVLSKLKRSAPGVGSSSPTIAELNSPGGDVLESLKLGYLFREFGVATMVRGGDTCLSACALAFLGGTESQSSLKAVASRTVEIGGTLGFHNFYLNTNHPLVSEAVSAKEGVIRGFNEAQGAASLLLHYAATLGVDPGFVARLLGRPAEVWDYADTAGELIDLNVCLAGTLPQPSPKASAVNICNNIVGAPPQVGEPRVRRMSQSEARRFLLEHVHRNVASMNVKGLLAAQLAAVVASRDDRLVEAIYGDLRNAGMPLPELVGSVYVVEGYAARPNDLQCVVSLSLDDPDRFDLVLQGQMGLIRPPIPSARTCGRLFTFDRGDVLNPQRK